MEQKWKESDIASYCNMMKSAVMMQQRRTNFTQRELSILLGAVAKRRRTILSGASVGQEQWASAWRDVAREVSAVEGIHRTAADVRKKWTYLKWEARNTTKPHRDLTSRTVLNILTKGSLNQPAKNNPPMFHLKDIMWVPGPPSSPASSSSTAVPLASTAGRPSSQAAMPQPPPPPVATPPPTQDDSAISVKWNTHAANMSSSIPNLLEDEKFVDVTLACDGRYIKCHKVILGACSTYFEELLSMNPCQHPIILMKDFQFWEVQAIVDFIYRGVVNIPQHQLPNLLQAANVLQIKGLTGAKTENEGTGSEIVSGEESTSTPIHTVTPNHTVTSTPTHIQKVSPIPIASASAPNQSSFRPKTLLLNFGKRKSTPNATNQNVVQSSVESPKHTSREPQNKLAKVTSSFCYEVSQLQSGSVSPALSSSGSSLHSCQDSGPSALVSRFDEQDMCGRLQVSTMNKQDSSHRSREASPGHFEVLTDPSMINIKEEPQEEFYAEDTGDPFEQETGS